MITGLRSALLCSKVEHRPDGSSAYIGILGADIYAGSRPGLIECWLTVQLDLDQTATSGALAVVCEGLEQVFPFETPDGYSDAAFALPLIIPVLREGNLQLSIRDLGAPGAERSVTWRLNFAPGAERMKSRGASERIVLVAQEAARTVAAQIAGLGSTRH
jgi:hypothetical protein